MIDNKKEVMRRLRIVKGHLQAIVFMVKRDRYCIDICQQIKAVKGALKKINSMILEEYLKNGGNFFRVLKIINYKKSKYVY